MPIRVFCLIAALVAAGLNCCCCCFLCCAAAATLKAIGSHSNSITGAFVSSFCTGLDVLISIVLAFASLSAVLTLVVSACLSLLVSAALSTVSEAAVLLFETESLALLLVRVSLLSLS